MQTHSDHDAHLANPQLYMVENGNQGPLNPAVLATKLHFEPAGQPIPASLRSWALLEQSMAGAASGEVSLTKWPRF
jgi:hypothetical protein